MATRSIARPQVTQRQQFESRVEALRQVALAVQWRIDHGISDANDIALDLVPEYDCLLGSRLA